MNIKENKDVIYEVVLTIPSIKSDDTYQIKQHCSSIKSLKHNFFKHLLYEEYKAYGGTLIGPAYYQRIENLRSGQEVFGDQRVKEVRIHVHYIYR